MVKILLVSRGFKHPKRGGVVNYTELLYNNLKNDDFEVKHFVLGFRNQFKFQFFLPIIYIYQIFEFKRLIRKFKPDIIHLNPSLVWGSILRDFIFLKISYKRSIKTLLFIRGWRKEVSKKFKKKFFRKYFKNNFKKSDIIIVLAEDFRNELVNLGLDSNKIKISSTMVASKSYYPKEKIFKKPYKILFCGHMIKYKGVYEILDSISQISELTNNLEFLMLGDGPDLNYLKNRAKELKIDPYISFLGFKSGKDKYDIFKKSHIFILPSYTEGFPNVILEAMAAGLPIISTKVGGLKDALKDGVNGFFLESIPPEPSDITDKLMRLINNPNLIKKISYNNILEANNKYDVGIVCNEIKKIYQTMVN